MIQSLGYSKKRTQGGIECRGDRYQRIVRFQRNHQMTSRQSPYDRR